MGGGGRRSGRGWRKRSIFVLLWWRQIPLSLAVKLNIRAVRICNTGNVVIFIIFFELILIKFYLNIQFNERSCGILT